MLARLLGHENVVKVFAVYGVEQRHAIIIMEYVGNRNLHHLLVERKEKHLSRDWLLEVAAQVENDSKQSDLFSSDGLLDYFCVPFTFSVVNAWLSPKIHQ